MQRITGEMAKRFREFDWATTPIGPPHGWSASWLKAVEISLSSGFPIALALGPKHIYFYNDAFISIGGPARHPHAIGLPVQEVWKEIWHPVLKSQFSETLSTGLPTGAEKLMLPLERSGYVEETYMTFSFAALRDDDGTPNGLFCTATENTALVIAQRQLDCLRRLASECVAADSPETACRLAAAVLEEQGRDVPFALLYHLAGRRFEMAASAGLNAVPARLRDGGDVRCERDPWSLEVVASTARPALIEHLAPIIAPALRARRCVPRQALVLPVPGAGSETPSCILVAGLNPMRPVAESSEFLELVATHLEKAIAGARAKQHAEERARQLAEIDRAKTHFFSNVSHELRTPLTLLLAPLAQVLAEEKLAPQYRELLEVAHRAGGRLLKLVSSLLEFSRIEAGRADARYVPTDLGPLTSDLAGMFHSLFVLAGIELVIDCPSTPEPAYVDPDMWERIVLNLLSNALKFTFEGRVAVRLRQRSGHFELRIADSGCGITETDLPRIFERFTPRSAPRARTVEGAGIGLSLVQELVKLHGGAVEASSQLGHGTTMTVRIPRGSSHLPPRRIGTSRAQTRSDSNAQLFLDEALGWLAGEDPPAAADSVPTERVEDGRFPQRQRFRQPRPASAVASAPPRERILVVDDNLEMRHYLSRLLRGRWQVQTSPDGLCALEQIRQHRPDLVIADIMMPRMDGLELLRTLRADPASTDLPVLLVSARAGAEASVNGLHAGADDYLVKPFFQSELIARIEARLAQVKQRTTERRARQEAQQAIRARDDFFDALAHELRSPAMSIFLWSEALRAENLSRRRRIGAVDSIELAARTIRRLAEDLHDVARAASGRIRVERRLFASLTPLVAAVTEAFAPAAAAKNITIRSSLARDSGPVLVDADRIQQVISNLLSNSIRYTAPGGYIEVHCRRDAEAIEIRVRDSGRGISAEALPHVFERYWQGRAAAEDGGLGLGLAIVRRLIELHDGRIEAMSDGEGRGSSFVVRLPVTSAEAVNAPSEPARPGQRVQDAARSAAEIAARQAASRSTGET